MIRACKSEFGIPVMADVSTLAEGIAAAQAGADIVATTLSGYTPYSRQLSGPDFELIAELAAAVAVPVITEGRIAAPAANGLAQGGCTVQSTPYFTEYYSGVSVDGAPVPIGAVVDVVSQPQLFLSGPCLQQRWPLCGLEPRGKFDIGLVLGQGNP